MSTFTKKFMKRTCQTFGNRPTNNWGSGDLPAPWCEGDVIELVGERPERRLLDLTGTMFVVSYATSIDEGDAWYFRVANESSDRGSDRLHVAYSERSTWDEDCDYMAAFRLVQTVDPEGLALRQRMLADGWETLLHVRCPTCGTHVWPEQLRCRRE